MLAATYGFFISLKKQRGGETTGSEQHDRYQDNGDNSIGAKFSGHRSVYGLARGLVDVTQRAPQ